MSTLCCSSLIQVQPLAADLNDNFEQLQMAIEENKCNMYDVSQDELRDLYLNRIDVDDQNAVLDGDLVKSTSTLWLTMK